MRHRPVLRVPCLEPAPARTRKTAAFTATPMVQYFLPVRGRQSGLMGGQVCGCVCVCVDVCVCVCAGGGSSHDMATRLIRRAPMVVDIIPFGTCVRAPHARINHHSGTNQFTFVYDSYAGPWCFCRDPGHGAENSSQYCTPALDTPEQINLQYASPTTVVVGFVTYELNRSATTAPPRASLMQQNPASHPGTNITIYGVTHRYAPPGRNSTSGYDKAKLNTLPYMMHYVALTVEPGSKYRYQVRSGGINTIWSAEYAFRAPGGLGENGSTAAGAPTTRIATCKENNHPSCHHSRLLCSMPEPMGR